MSRILGGLPVSGQVLAYIVAVELFLGAIAGVAWLILQTRWGKEFVRRAVR